MKRLLLPMAKNRIREPTLGKAAAARSYCVAAAADGGGGGGEYKPLYRRLSALGSSDSRGGVEDVMRGWLKEGRKVTHFDLMGMVREFRKFKNHKVALELTDWMEKEGGNSTFTFHAVRLDLISKVRGADMAERYFSSLPALAKDHRSFGALLSCYCQEKMAEKAIALFDKLKELNFVTTLSYNNITTLYVKSGQPEKVPMYFQEMKAVNISPDTVTYGLLINSYVSLNDTHSVERVLEEMEVRKIDFHWSIYCNLATYYNSAGIYQKTESALKKAEEIMDHRDRNAYHSLISLYAGAGNLAEVLRIWKLLKANFKKMTNMSYHNMLTALKTLDEMDGMNKCFEEWELNHQNFDPRLLNVVIDAYLRKGMVEEAKLLRDKSIEKGHGLDFKTLDLFTDYYLERREMDSALKFLEGIACSESQCKWHPSEEKVNAFRKCFEEVKDDEGVERFCQILKMLK